MVKQIFIDAVHSEETRVAVVENKKVVDYDVETTTKPQIKGNVYLAKVIRVEPSLQSCFVDYGTGKNGFLPFSEIHPDYYQIPVEARKKIIESIHSESDADDVDDDAEVMDFNDLDDGEDNKELLKKLREYRIQDVIKPKQIILVQGVKEERQQKGAALTTYLSLPGRFAVLMPNSRKKNAYGISKKINDREERKRLRDVLKELKIPVGMTVVLRTAAFGMKKADIKKDYDYLISLWNDIRKTTLESIAPALIYQEDFLLRRVVRDFIIEKDDSIFIQGAEGAEAIRGFYKQLHGRLSKNIIEYNGDIPLFVANDIEEQLEGLHKPEVILPSGGAIVINQTEALVAIDDNSSRAIKEKSVEDMALNINLEAVEEIARQLKLRDLAGLVVIDLIDMDEDKNNQRVEQKMREALKKDRARIQVGKINGFGVLMLSRQRLRSTLIESSYVECPYCQGAGVVPSVQTASIMMLRHIQEKLMAKPCERMLVSVPSDVAMYILNQKKYDIARMEKQYNTDIIIYADDSLMNINQYQVQRGGVEREKLDEIFKAHKPVVNTKKLNQDRQNAKKIISETPTRRKRKFEGQSNAKKKDKSLWDKLLGS